MRPRNLILAVVVVAAALVCVRLGFWQLSRLEEKKALNAALLQALSETAQPLGSAPTASLIGHKVFARGVFDERVHFLLAGRARRGAPGVHVVTPLVATDRDGPAVLVDRGWLSSGDATWARPQEHAEPGERAVVGIAEPLGADARPGQMREEDGVRLISRRRLDPDSVTARLSYAIEPIVLRELPGPGVPAQPARAEPKPADESMHLSYAAQWFLFAAILLIGPVVVALTRKRPHP